MNLTRMPRAASLLAVAGCLALALPLAAQDPNPAPPAAEGGEGRMKPPELTPEQRQQAMSFFEQSREMTPEQRQKALQEQPFFKSLGQGPQERMLQRAGQQPPSQGAPGGGMGMPPELRERLEKMSPEEREQFKQQMRQRHEQMKERFEKLSPEEKQQVQAFREKAASMTPEQRLQEMDKIPFFQGLPAEQRQMMSRHMGGGPGGQGGKGGTVGNAMPSGQRPGGNQAQGNTAPPGTKDGPGGGMGMPPELREKLAKMSPEERQQFRQKMEQRRSEFRERLEKLSPEDKQKMKEFHEKAATMTPEQRGQEMAKLPLFKDMTPEQRQAHENRFQKFQQMSPEQREKVKKNFERWQQMSPEQRQHFRDKFKERRASAQGDAPAAPVTPPSVPAAPASPQP